MKYKVLIAHSAQQHSFKTASALKKSGYLYKYITTVYDKENSLTSKIKVFLNGDNLKRANTRKSKDIDDNDVKLFNEGLSLVLLLLQRLDKKKQIYNLLDRFIIYSFNKKVAKYAIRHNVDAIIMYDTLCKKTFKILSRKAPNIKLILDMSAPNVSYMDYIFNLDIKKNKLYESNLYKEINTPLYKKILKDSKDELILADYFLVASNFTKKSLNFSDIEDSRIFKCNYGIDSEMYKLKFDCKDKFSEKIKCIFIGNVTQRKGIHYLLKVIDRINLEIFEFKILGNIDKNSEYFIRYKDKCEFTGHVTKDEVIKHCNESDVIIFPSLADGFGLSVLEALACETIAICSENSGVSDIVENYYNGFVVPAMNDKEIYNKLIWIYNNKDKVNQMKLNSRHVALQCTWESYNKSIKYAIDNILNDCVYR